MFTGKAGVNADHPLGRLNPCAQEEKACRVEKQSSLYFLFGRNIEKKVGSIEVWGLYYKTYHGLNLRIFRN
jgi:hypothetical protein